MTVKIEAMNGETPEPFEYGNVFAREQVGGRARLRVGLDEAQDAAVATLACTLRGPFQLLYVLHTTRTGAELGRYETPELTSADVELFLSEFGRFICEDSRHDLWVRSHDDDATIVFDRHNLIFAYGPLELFERELQSSGAREGEPALLAAHVHHYHPEWDDAERGVLRRFEWRVTPASTLGRAVRSGARPKQVTQRRCDPFGCGSASVAAPSGWKRTTDKT